MDERALQFRVGAMVVGSLFVAILLLIVFNNSHWLLRGRYTVYMKFAQAPGVTQDTPIRKSGVLIGRVTDVTLRERDVLVTAKIDNKYPIYEHEVCRIGSESLLGDSMIEFDSPGPQNLGQPLGDGALIEGYMRNDMMQAMDQAMQAMKQASNALEVVTRLEDDVTVSLADFRVTSQRFGQLAAHLDQMATQNEDQLARVVQKSETAMDSFQLAMNNINSLVGDEQMRRDLQASLAGVPQLIEETRIAVNKYGAVAERADRSLEGVEKFTDTMGTLGESGQRMSANVDQITEKLDRLILDLLTMSDAINNQEGTIGKLVYDPELYQRLNRAADNVEQVSFRLKPIVEDVRVFTDKIARDPRQLGVRGALSREQTGSKFLPFNFFYQQPTMQPGYQYHGTPPMYSQPGAVHTGVPCENCDVPSPVYHEQIPTPAPRPVQSSAYQYERPQLQPQRAATTPQQFWQTR